MTVTGEYAAQEGRARDAVAAAATDLARAVHEAATLRAAAAQAKALADSADCDAKNSQHVWEKRVQEWQAVLAKAVLS